VQPRAGGGFGIDRTPRSSSSLRNQGGRKKVELPAGDVRGVEPTSDATEGHLEVDHGAHPMASKAC